MKYKEKLNNLIQRVSTKAALLLLGGMLFVGCGDGGNDKGEAEGGNQAGKNAFSLKDLKEEQQDLAKRDAYSGILARFGIREGGWSSFSKRVNFMLNEVPMITSTKDSDKAKLEEESKRLNGTKGVSSKFIPDGDHQDDKRGGWTIAYGSLLRDKVLKFVADPASPTKASAEFSGYLKEAIEAALGGNFLKRAETAAKDDGTNPDKNRAVGTALTDEVKEAFGLLFILFDKTQQFCDCFKEGKYDKKGAEGIIAATKGLTAAKFKGGYKVNTDVNQELSKEDSTERDFNDAEKKALNKLVEKFEAELKQLDKGSLVAPEKSTKKKGEKAKKEGEKEGEAEGEQQE